jgi:nucleotide-binding universal stress UspA family protein
MIKSILAAVDGSAPAESAMSEAITWARTLKANVKAVFVEEEARFMYIPPISSVEGGVVVPVPLPEEEYDRENEKVKAEGDAIRQRYEAKLRGTDVQGTFSRPRGNVNDMLAKEAVVHGMVVMGRRGKNDPPGSTKPGRTTEELIHASVRPVLVVPAGTQSKGPALFAYDGSKGANRVLVPGAYLAAQAGYKVRVVTVNKDRAVGEAVQAHLHEFFGEWGLTAEYEVRSGDAGPQILRAADDAGAGFIVMGAYGRNPLHDLFFGSVTGQVIEQASCPMLVMA